MTGNVVFQQILQKNVVISQGLMGIGTGAGVSGSGEKAVFRLLAKHHQPPFCVFDVGANKGQFLELAIESMAGIDFSIHCFEPGADTFRVLSQRSVDHRVKLNKFGIGKSSGDQILYYDTPGSGHASLTKRKLEYRGIQFDQSETVQIKTIDDYCTENTIDRIHLLKVDIEGHELDAFAGATGMFAKKAIDMVTFEFGGCNIDTRTFFREFWDFFSNLNMTIYRITPSGYLSRLPKYKEVHEQYRTTNFVATRND
jgi:FkbM family methyltransferase